MKHHPIKSSVTALLLSTFLNESGGLPRGKKDDGALNSNAFARSSQQRGSSSTGSSGTREASLLTTLRDSFPCEKLSDGLELQENAAAAASAPAPCQQSTENECKSNTSNK